MIEDVANLMMDDDPPSTPQEREAARDAWHTRITIGAAGFFLAVMLAAINAIAALRGSTIVVQPPEQVLLYRDGEGENAVLTMAVRLAMINAADSQQGDVLMEAAMTPITGGPSFKFTGIVKPVFQGCLQPRARSAPDVNEAFCLLGQKADEMGESNGWAFHGMAIAGMFVVDAHVGRMS